MQRPSSSPAAPLSPEVGLLSPTAQLSAYRSTLEAQLRQLQEHCANEASHTAGCIAALAAELASCEVEGIVSRQALMADNTVLRNDNAMLRAAVHRLHAQLLCASVDAQTLRAEVRCAEEGGAAESTSAMRLQDSSLRVAEARRQQDARARSLEVGQMRDELRAHEAARSGAAAEAARSRAHCTCLAAELAQLEQQECAEASAMLWRSSGVILEAVRLVRVRVRVRVRRERRHPRGGARADPDPNPDPNPNPNLNPNLNPNPNPNPYQVRELSEANHELSSAAAVSSEALAESAGSLEAALPQLRAALALGAAAEDAAAEAAARDALARIVDEISLDEIPLGEISRGETASPRSSAALAAGSGRVRGREGGRERGRGCERGSERSHEAPSHEAPYPRGARRTAAVRRARPPPAAAAATAAASPAAAAAAAAARYVPRAAIEAREAREASPERQAAWLAQQVLKAQRRHRKAAPSGQTVEVGGTATLLFSPPKPWEAGVPQPHGTRAAPGEPREAAVTFAAAADLAAAAAAAADHLASRSPDLAGERAPWSSSLRSSGGASGGGASGGGGAVSQVSGASEPHKRLVTSAFSAEPGLQVFFSRAQRPRGSGSPRQLTHEDLHYRGRAQEALCGAAATVVALPRAAANISCQR